MSKLVGANLTPAGGGGLPSAGTTTTAPHVPKEKTSIIWLNAARDGVTVEGRCALGGDVVPVRGTSFISTETLSPATVSWLRLLPSGVALTGDIPDTQYTGTTFAGRDVVPSVMGSVPPCQPQLLHQQLQQPVWGSTMCIPRVFDLARLLGDACDYLRTGDLMEYTPLAAADAIASAISTCPVGRHVVLYAEVPAAVPIALPVSYTHLTLPTNREV